MSDAPGLNHDRYGVTPTATMASMAGIDFVRAIFSGKLPEPPIMQTVEPFDCSAEPGIIVIHSVPGIRHYNPIGSVHGGYAATLLDSAMGLAVHSMLPVGTGYTTLEFKISFVRGMTGETGAVRTEGRTLHVGRRTATAEARITDAKGRLLAHATTTCLVFGIPVDGASAAMERESAAIDTARRTI
ncbi:MAG: PaaI family thioesterase [Bradyrhizobium sp.]|uniref:PaaI family thioesterase n=1 Tax=Bradyrhizobium sp. TaxID=376 RepID=UPI0023A57AB0|nr:PaaI family thioesterase [Bradyrhizobium sp.]MDE2602760.1 PaaI family thioesterase [Bradyrhizobium sp.]